MIDTVIRPFADVQDRLARDGTQAHLLVGNGFSRALRNDIFSYDALFNRADFGRLPDTARAAFTAIGTTDFEFVMRTLRSAASLLEVYLPNDLALRQQLLADANALRELLAATIAANHPEGPFEIDDEAYAACRKFLGPFRNIYTLNYDLLLYWTLMHDESEPHVKCDDGFRTPQDGEAEYVTWEVEQSDAQNIHYLHGALHVFDAKTTIQKFTWSNTGTRLIEQIRAALAQDKYPLIVAEGESERKLERILHSNYLSRSYRSFSKIAGSLVVFGHSMHPNDEHIIHLIDSGKTRLIFVGLHGDPGSAVNQRIVARMNIAQATRPSRRPLDVYFFDSATATVWG